MQMLSSLCMPRPRFACTRCWGCLYNRNCCMRNLLTFQGCGVLASMIVGCDVLPSPRQGPKLPAHLQLIQRIRLMPRPVPQVVRLSSQDVPTAYAYELEAATIVQPEQVENAIRRVVGSRQMALA